MDSFVVKNGKKLKKGFTTGSAAAAAAKAAVKILFSDSDVSRVKIDTPAGVKLNLPLEKVKKNGKRVEAGIRKDAGDDPDITDGLLIFAEVKKSNNNPKKVLIRGGEGVGRVEKPGLPVEIGKAAVNPVPQKMIKNEVKKVLPEGNKVEVKLKIPEGKKIAKKTLNPELGIKGGLSILGTTGIVEPMSHQAFKDSISVKLKQIVGQGIEEVVLVFGNYGKNQALNQGYKDNKIIKMSNYVGYMLDKCLENNIKKVVILGHIGKLIKVAGGIFNTHSKVADGRLEIMAAYTAACGGSQDLIKKILKTPTTESAVTMIINAGFTEVFEIIIKKVYEKCRQYVNEKMQVHCQLYSMEKGFLVDFGCENEEDF